MATPPAQPARSRGSPCTPGGNPIFHLPSPSPGSLTNVEASWGSAISSSSTNPPVVGNNTQLSSNLQQLSEEFKSVFDHPSNGADAAGRLHSIQQGPRSIAKYTLEFRTLAANSGWDDNALRSAYRRGLSEEMKDLLVRDRPASHSLVTLALLMDERLWE